MEKIWKTLPNDLTRHILSFSDDIDIRLQFKIAPRPLPKSRLEYPLLNNGLNRYHNVYGDIGVYIVFPDAKYFTYKAGNCIWYEWRFGVEDDAPSILPPRYLRCYEYKLQ